MKLTKLVEGDDTSLYCYSNLIISLIKRGMMSDVNHASVSVHNHAHVKIWIKY